MQREFKAITQAERATIMTALEPLGFHTLEQGASEYRFVATWLGDDIGLNVIFDSDFGGVHVRVTRYDSRGAVIRYRFAGWNALDALDSLLERVDLEALKVKM